MKKHFLLLTALIILLTILCSCEPEPIFYCIDCGKEATIYMGAEFRDYSTVDLYYCDDCYDKAFEEKYKDYPVAPTIPR